MSIVVRDCIDPALPRCVIGLENFSNPFNQSNAKLTATWSLAISRVVSSLPV